MPPTKKKIKPRTFFLNETHELEGVAKGGGGRVPQYTDISWAAKASQISSSLKEAAETVRSSRDPLKKDRFFVLARPVPEVQKR